MSDSLIGDAELISHLILLEQEITIKVGKVARLSNTTGSLQNPTLIAVEVRPTPILTLT